MIDIHNLLGRQAAFVPFCMKDKGGKPSDQSKNAKPVRGVIDYINAEHGWFSISYHVGNYKFREGFKMCDIGTEVTLIGRR